MARRVTTFSHPDATTRSSGGPCARRRCSRTCVQNTRASRPSSSSRSGTFAPTLPTCPPTPRAARTTRCPTSRSSFFPAATNDFTSTRISVSRAPLLGATQQAQKLLARATASLGCDPRTPGAFAMEPAVPKPTPQQQQLMGQLYRSAWGFEQFLASTGIDMSKAPELPPQEPAPAVSLEEVAFGSGAPAGHRELASGTGDAQGATQGDPAGDADSSDDEGAGLGEDANRDGGDDSGDDSGDDDGDDGDGDNTPPSPPSPGEMHATQRRASTRARKAPRRSL